MFHLFQLLIQDVFSYCHSLCKWRVREIHCHCSSSVQLYTYVKLLKLFTLSLSSCRRAAKMPAKAFLMASISACSSGSWSTRSTSPRDVNTKENLFMTGMSKIILTQTELLNFDRDFVESTKNRQEVISEWKRKMNKDEVVLWLMSYIITKGGWIIVSLVM